MDYSEMTPEQKRMAIAKDVITHVRTERLRPQCGAYLLWNDDFRVDVIDKGNAAEVMQHCTVCAKGAMVLTRIDRFNSLTLPASGRIFNADCVESLDDIFDEWQLELIEAAFECAAQRDLEYEELLEVAAEMQAAVAFGELHETPTDRLVAIMQNIIDNNGTFSPPVSDE